MPDLKKIQMSSKASSNKVWQQGTGSFSTGNLPGVGEINGGASIPHNFGSDGLIMQVNSSTDIAGSGTFTTLPWSSNDGRVYIYASVDAFNINVIRINTDSSGFGFPPTTVNFSYRLLVP